MKHQVRNSLYRALVLVAAIGLAFCTNADSTPTFTIPAGGTFTVPGVFQSGNAATNACDYQISVLVKALGDATIKVTRPSGATEGAIYFTPVATNGTLTLDLTDWAGYSFRLDGGIVSGGAGTLVVKGRDALVVGCGRFDFRTDFGTSSSVTKRNASRPVAFEQVTFVDAAGTPYASPAGITLAGAFLDIGISTSATCPWTVAADAVASVDFPHGLIARYVSDSRLDLSTFDVWALNPAALAGVDTVRVSPGRTLKLQPRQVASYDNRHYGWDGVTSATFASDIELLGEGATLLLSQHYTMTLTGDITGTGAVKMELEFQNGYGKRTDLTGNVDYAGPLGMALSYNATNYTLRLSGTADLSRNQVTLTAGTVLSLDCATPSMAIDSVATATAPGVRAGLPLGYVELSKKIRTLTAEEVSQAVRFVGVSSFSNTVTVGSMPYGGTVYDNALVNVVPGAGLSDTVRIRNPSGCVLYRLPDGTNAVSFANMELGDTGEYTLPSQAGLIYECPPDNFRLEVGEGASTKLLMGNHKAQVCMDGGALTLGRSQDGKLWKKHVMLWLDPSQTDSWRYWTYNGSEGYEDSGTYKVLGPWGDWRGDSVNGVYMINDKHYLSNANTICPFVVPDGLNGMPYVSFSFASSRNRRMTFFPVGTTNYTGTAGYTAISPKFAVLVFGSQNGGGLALFGNSSKYYMRGGGVTTRGAVASSTPIFANSAIPTWVNGERVDPSVRGLSGGWDVISVNTSSANVNGLGVLEGIGTTSTMGGQAYAEILFFDEVLSDEDRADVECYLAQKWGLLENYNAQGMMTVRATMFGSGSVTLESDAELSGAFTGSVDLNGHALAFAAAELPPDASDITDIAGRVAWFDPDDASRLVLNSTSVARMFAQGVDMSNTAGAMCLDAVSRTPKVVVESRGCGPVRRWLDYSASRFPASTSGRSLRVQHYGVTSQYGVDAVTGRTVFLVQDSSRGGGTPFMSTVGDTGTLLSPRLTMYAAMPPDPYLPIWRDKSATTFAAGMTYLDGRAVNGAKQGFNGRPELLTAVGGKDFPFGAVGYCQYMEGVPVDVRPDVGEIQGEIIVYDRVLSDADRGKVEAYLMNKWLGTVNSGYGVYTNITLTGSGSVTLASLAQRPRFAAGFTGSVTLPEDAFAFTIRDKVVEGALDFGGGTASFPASCTLDVVFGSAPSAGTYRLISSAGLSSPVVWTLNVSVRSGSMRKPSCRLVAAGGNVDLVVDPSGMTIVFR